MIKDLESKRLVELREIAKENGMTNFYKYKKNELINELAILLDKSKTTSKDTNKVKEQDKTTTQNQTKSNDRDQDQAQEQSKQEDRTSHLKKLDSGVEDGGILEVLPDGFGFLRQENFLPGNKDIYMSPAQIRRFRLKTGDYVKGNLRIAKENEKFRALLYINSINGQNPNITMNRKNFEDLTPIYPRERLTLEGNKNRVSSRLIDIIAPIGKGQRGVIVAPPKTGKTTLLKEIANSITENNPKIHLIVLLIDERPEEVTDMKRSIIGENVEVIYSTFDEVSEHHKRVAEMVLERCKRLVEQNMDVVVLLDSITRLARAYNLIIPPSGRTLSGGLDPASLYMPKKFFGAARNIEDGGSLTILGSALIDTGSRMDDVIFEEFKGTGNMELVLDSKLSNRRIYPAIDLVKSGTRRDDLLLTKEEQDGVYTIRKLGSTMVNFEFMEEMVEKVKRTKNNAELIALIKELDVK